MDSSKRIERCLHRLVAACLGNPSARLRLDDKGVTVLLLMPSGNLSVVGTCDLASERVTVELMDMINRVKRG